GPCVKAGVDAFNREELTGDDQAGTIIGSSARAASIASAGCS
ncbi:MAG: hypothetical protein QOF01_3400, partial [Thermomicrobiales bacterium]|nr:hypothetical protein [Thermomicrobiales bacterium]